jgi:YD repeat-containing protein
MAAGDWKQLKRPIPGSTGQNHDFTLFSGTHQISTVTQTDGTPTLGPTAIRYDSRGNRNLDDNQATSPLTNDERTYLYDDRRNLINVRGQYFTSGSRRYYNVTSTFDAKNRRVSKSFHDETSGKVATWFFYYDPLDRLSEVRHRDRRRYSFEALTIDRDTRLISCAGAGAWALSARADAEAELGAQRHPRRLRDRRDQVRHRLVARDA